jgi:HEPN superfamily RiboL-PSP-like protein
MSEKDAIAANVVRNLGRVRNLAKIYIEKLSGVGSGRRTVNSADVLRAATVLLHATLEDFLRDLARWKLPLANAEALNEIPIAGSEGKATRFSLDSVARFRGRGVDDLIADSVTEHLNQATYNNVSDIKKLLRAIGQNETKVDEYADQLGPMMARRHHIVHRADKNEKTGVGQYSAQSLGHETVVKWIACVEGFAEQVLEDV